MSRSDLRTPEMTDVHMHVIPGVDDGALDLPMALRMLAMAWSQGVRTVFATPHAIAFRAQPGETKARFAELRTEAAALLPQLRLLLGCEVLCEAGRMEQVLEALRSGLFPTMGGTDYVLMELAPWGRAEDALLCAEALARSGYRPILAHGERYPYLRQDLPRMDRLRDLGGKIQINAYSLAEETDPAILAWARELVLTGRADYLGTDAHRTYHRPPRAQAGLAWLCGHADRAYAEALARENARRDLMEGQRG